MVTSKPQISVAYNSQHLFLAQITYRLQVDGGWVLLYSVHLLILGLTVTCCRRPSQAVQLHLKLLPYRGPIVECECSRHLQEEQGYISLLGKETDNYK